MATKKLDVLTSTEECRKKFLKCMQQAGQNPLKQQQCLVKYLACLLPALNRTGKLIASTKGGGPPKSPQGKP